MDGHRADTSKFSVAGEEGVMPNSGRRTERRITVHLVNALSAPKSGNRVLWDSDLTGFGVRITATGAVSFVLRYVINGRERRYTIGKHPDLSPSAARERATVLRGRIATGQDPLEIRTNDREAATVGELCDDYLERHARPKKRPKSVMGDEQLIRLYIRPKLGARKVSSISRRDLDEAHQALKAHPYQANRLVALLSKMFSLAVAWGWRSDNPAKGIGRFAEDRRHRWLSVDELGALSKAVSNYPDKRIADAIRLMILTGARRGEVLNATWDQFDFGRGVWVKPSHHTKQKKTEHVPLSGSALALVSGMKAATAKAIGDEKELSKFPFLFPGNAEGKPLQDLKKAWKTICAAAGIKGARIHDLRHTYASHLVSGGHSLPLVGRLLGHTQAATTHRYAHLADDPLRKATEEFGTIFGAAGRKRAKRKTALQSENPSGNVVRFRARKSK